MRFTVKTGERMRLGIYLDNAKINIKDFSSIELANPGIGGTEYEFIIFIRNIKKYLLDAELAVYQTKEMEYSDTVDRTIIVQNMEEAISLASEQADIMIVRTETDRTIPKASKGCKIITWSHNYFSGKIADDIANREDICANVFVGRQFYESYLDHDIIKKSTYIYNCMDFLPLQEKRNVKELKPICAYIGSLVPAKSFHVLAEAWPLVVKEIPEARLWVIGSSGVYGLNSGLGDRGLAEKCYEERFISSLSTVLDSVTFYGNVGKDKCSILKQVKVGVINPSGVETFGISAVDFSSMEIPVISRNRYGVKDVVLQNRTGILINNPKKLAKTIIKLLEDNELNQALGEAGRKYVTSEFCVENSMKKWTELLALVNLGNSIPFKKPTESYFNNYKFLRIIIRWIRKSLHLSNRFALCNLLRK